MAATFHSSDEEHGAVEPGGFDSYNKEEYQNTKYIDMFQPLIIINTNSNFFFLVKWCTIWTQNEV